MILDANHQSTIDRKGSPVVSVIMPAFNAAPYIRQALDSVFAQHFPDLEIIVVDDGSTDDTLAVLAPYDSRICLLQQPNGGPAAARNTALQAARGEFVCFLDADDWMLPDKLLQQAAYLTLRPHLGLVHSGWRIIDEQGNARRDVEPWRELPQITLEQFVDRRAAKLGPMMFRRSWLESVGGFDPTLRHAEDVDLMFRLLLAGCQAEWIYRPTICYRVHHGSTLHREAELQSVCLPAVLDKLFAHPALPEEVRQREKTIRYFDEVWLAWHAWRMGRTSGIPPHLQKALEYSDKTPDLVLLEWWHLWMGWTELDGREVDAFLAQLPVFKEIAGVPDDLWPLLMELISWWQQNQPLPSYALPHPQQAWRFWQNTVDAGQFSMHTVLDWQVYGWYTAVHAHQPMDAARFRELSPEEIITLLKNSIVMDTGQVDVEDVTAVWRDGLAQGLVPASRQAEVTGLYLTLMGQAMIGRKWAQVWEAFLTAARQGVNLAVLQAWVSFFRAGLAFTLK